MNTPLKVLLVELNVNRNVLPLVSGYLQSYACADPDVRSSYHFSILAESSRTPFDDLQRDLIRHHADIYAFSCYVWNMKLIRRLVRGLRDLRPRATILLGGPQVDHNGHHYIDRDCDRVFVANGEGERICRDFLLAAATSRPMTTVPGLTFALDGEIVNTPDAKPIEDINTIPSPFLSGIYDGTTYSSTVWETNRGCPYLCTFCYWGKGDDRSVRKFDDDRLRAELEWLARKSVCYMHMGDANWGLLQRDVELSREIVRCKERFGAPLMITFSAAKAKIDRSSEIAAIFHDAGIVSAQAIGIQSTSDAVLQAIRRKNIKLPLLMEASREMERRGVSTYAELIWPLPGETFESFKTCLSSLCGAEVTSVVIYPALLLHATPMEHQVEEFAIETTEADDDVSELQIVVSTRHVTPSETVDGIWLSFATYCLYNARGLRHLGRYLHDKGILPWAELFWAFARFCRAGSSAAAAHWTRVVERRTHAEQHALGELVHLILHEQRHDHLVALSEFARAQPWWHDEQARMLFELDLINCPYVYSNTPFTPVPPALLPLQYVDVQAVEGRRARVTASEACASLVSRRVLGEDAEPATTFDVSYQHKQFAFMPKKPLRENFTYVYGMIHRSAIINPRWTARHGRQRPCDGQ